MPHRTGPTNQELAELIEFLKSEGYKGNKFLARLGYELEKPTRRRREVGLSNINRVSKEGEMVVVPGKVLDGKVDKKLTVAAWKFSESAKQSIEKAGGKVLTIQELIKSGKSARIIG